MKVVRTQTGYVIEITDAEAKGLYQCIVVRKLTGNLMPAFNVLDGMGVMICQEVERASKSAKKAQSKTKGKSR